MASTSVVVIFLAVLTISAADKQDSDGLLNRLRRIYTYTPTPPPSTIRYGYTTDSADSGTISSPNYPNTYPINNIYYHQIGSEFGRQVELRFTFFDLEDCKNCTCDSLTIFAERTLTYCGSNLPNNGAVIHGVTPLTIKFKSDGSFGRAGYFASYTTSLGTTVPSTPHPTFPASSPVIKYHFVTDAAKQGTISSPNYPSGYTANSVYYTQIGEHYGYQVLIHFRFFHVEKCGTNCTCDSVTVFSGDGTEQTFCGDNLPNKDGIVFGLSPVTVKFQSDASVNDQGYYAAYEIRDDVISTSGWPDKSTQYTTKPYNYQTTYYYPWGTTGRYPQYSTNHRTESTYNPFIPQYSTNPYYSESTMSNKNYHSTSYYPWVSTPYYPWYTTHPYNYWTTYNPWWTTRHHYKTTQYHPPYTTMPHHYQTTRYDWGTTGYYPQQTTPQYYPQTTYYYPFGTTHYYPQYTTQPNHYETTRYNWGTTGGYPQYTTYPPYHYQTNNPPSQNNCPGFCCPQCGTGYQPEIVHTTGCPSCRCVSIHMSANIPKSLILQVLQNLSHEAHSVENFAHDLSQQVDTVSQWLNRGQIDNNARRSLSIDESAASDKINKKSKDVSAADVYLQGNQEN